MTNITVLPHPDYCPEGHTFAASPGTSICDALLEHGVEMDHACGKVGACTTCHLVVREGFASLNPTSSAEEDMLDRAWGIDAQSRLSCQAVIGMEALLIEIPKYSINHAKEQG